MNNFNTTYLKYIAFVLFPLVIGSSRATADLPLPMASGNASFFENLPITEARELFPTGDSILWFSFLLWIAYIIFCFPKDTFKKL